MPSYDDGFVNSVYFVIYVFDFQCVFEVSKENGLILTELWPGVSIQDIQISTGCTFQVSTILKSLEFLLSSLLISLLSMSLV